MLAAFVSPYRVDRDNVRALLPEGAFVEIHVDADLETCKERDPKGLYAKAVAGKIGNFTGISAPYAPPENPDVVRDTSVLGSDQCVDAVMDAMRSVGVEPGP